MPFMRFLSLFSLFLALSPLVRAQLQPYNKAMIWRGFQHRWTYNHRCNRVGDAVVYNGGKPQSLHFSATGLGPDSTYFTGYYTYIETPDVVFKEGQHEIKIESREKQLSEGVVTVTVPADSWLRGCTNYVSLINGFDLKSDEAADKIQLLRFAIDDPEYDTTGNNLKFKIKYSLVLNCQSVECPGGRKVNYTLNLYYLLMGLNEYTARSTEQFFTRSYSWDKKEEVNDLPEEKLIDGIGMPIYNAATVGIKAFSVVLNEAHWMLQMNTNVTPVRYDAYTGDMKLSVDLLFKEWQEGMRGNEVMPVQSRFAEKRRGWVLLDCDVLLLQMRHARIEYARRTGRMYWRGYNQSAGRDDSVNILQLNAP